MSGMMHAADRRGRIRSAGNAATWEGTMRSLIVRLVGRKQTVGEQIAEEIRASLAAADRHDGSWWRTRSQGMIDHWMGLAAQHEPAPAQVRAAGRVARLEYRWFRVRRRELEAIRAGLAATPDAELGPENADCLRACASTLASRVGAARRQTWANEWRFYVEALAALGITPHHDVPPSFSGQFPDGRLDDA